MMAELSKLLVACDIKFNAKDRHIMCFPHIINLCTQAVLTVFDSPNKEKLDDMYADVFQLEPAKRDKYVAAIMRKLISSGRDIVRTIRASGMRHDAQLIESGNQNKWFKDSSGQAIVVPQVQL